MSDIAIDIQGISKQYKRGAAPRIQNWGDIARTIRHLRRPPAHDNRFWALKEVSFTLRQGEILGIIGENGAGKSTLLKILARTVAPTQGKIVMHGRVGALLEVGTGFHDELTGRENVYLNGAILGLKHREITQRFDEIVDFAGVASFIDTPVKHYSSGMRLRLGFAVAAHLDPEILIVDEVLAVGDAEFQRKCIGKMQTVANEGRTVLFVSHAMRTVQQLCTRAIYLKQGQIVADDTPDAVIHQYLLPLTQHPHYDPTTLIPLPRSNKVMSDAPRIARFQMLDERGQPTDQFRLAEPLRFRMGLQTTRPMKDFFAIIRIETQDHVSVTTLRSGDYRYFYAIQPDQMLFIQAVCDSLYLEPGKYYVSLFIRDQQRLLLDELPYVAEFYVNEVPFDSHAPNPAIVGIVATHSSWSHQTRAIDTRSP